MIPLAELCLDFRLSYEDFELKIELETAAHRLGIFGPSGSGKTTLLDILAGLRAPDEGRVVVNGNSWYDRDGTLFKLPEARRVGYLMQDAPLFPHRTVEANIRFGTHGSRNTTRDELIDILEIDDLLDRYPGSLSGGERRRVSLAQVLNADPDLLLLDEPLIGLNESLRSEIRPSIRRVIETMDIPSIVVSHRPGIMTCLAETIIPLEGGTVSEAFDVSQFFQNRRLRKRGILGETNYYEATVREADTETDLLTATTNGGLTFHLLPQKALSGGDRVLVSFSAREPIIGTTNPRTLSPRNHWSATVNGLQSDDGSCLLTLSTGGETMWARVTDATVDTLDIETDQTLDVLMKSHSLSIQRI